LVNSQGDPIVVPSVIDSNTLITFKNLPFTDFVNEVFRANSIITSSTSVLSQGQDCLGSSCVYFCYNKDEGRFKFNTLGLSTFGGGGVLTKSSFSVSQNQDKSLYLQNDVDNSGAVDDLDITPIINHVLGANILQGSLFNKADVTCDDDLSIYDIRSVVLAK
jgi:hypothetical protein